MIGMEIMVRRSRGRPRDPDKDATIRDAAWRILADKGYEGLTFEAVAETAGCSRATLYRRFASKVELVAAILEETSRAVEPDLEPDGSPRDALVAHATACAVYLSEHRGQAIIALGVSAAKVPELVAAIQMHSDKERDYYRREFQRLAPGADAEDVEFACHTLIGGVVYHVAILKLRLLPARIGKLVDHAIGLVKG